MSRPFARAIRALQDPWTLLTAGVAGGATWAIGLPLAGAGLVAVGSLAAAGLIGAMVRSEQREPRERPLARGTEQAQLIATLDEYRANLRRLSGQQLTPEVAQSAADAVSVAENSRVSALQVARAVDILDDGLAQGQSVRSYTDTGSKSVQAAVARMASRRTGLLNRLRGAVDQVAQIYAQLLELSTTASTLDVSVDGGGSDVTAISDSLTALQQTFTELESDAAAVRTGKTI
jgi:hypothetical protein